MAQKYGKTPAQIILRWGLQRGFFNIPKSVNKSRIEENSRIFDFELTHDDFNALFAVNKDKRYGPDPETFDF
jgi:diketogulonate reductase-like aldo/keto reductase